MSETIYTIPIVEAFSEKGECPFCNMFHKIESDSLEFILDTAYMEDYIRMETDKKGFCQKHFLEMLNGSNRLGLSLMSYTHLQFINNKLKKYFDEFEKSEPTKKNLFSFGKSKSTDSFSKNFSKEINTFIDDCFLCDRNKNTFKRYVDNFFHLYKKKHDIINLLKSSQGFCLPHFSMLISLSEEKLSATENYEFLKIIIPLQKENLSRIEEEISWFIDKFDYRYKDEPWKNSKDALPRTIQKLSSIKPS